MLALGIRYLNGFVAATEPESRNRPEWPPHPGRVFMALAAACFQTGADPAEREVLEWLEKQQAPRLYALDAQARGIATHYVPVNDRSGDTQKPPKAILQAVPALTRDRQPRTFARAWLEDEIVRLVWPDVEPSEEQRKALEGLCSKVTRIGHSMSLVQMWVCDPKSSFETHWVPDDEHAEIQLRIAVPGTLGDLARRFNAEKCDEYARLKVEAEDDSDQKKQKTARKKLKEQFNNEAPPRLRPQLPIYQGYARTSPLRQQERPILGTLFNPNLLVWALERANGPYRELDLLCSLALSERWREALLSRSQGLSQEGLQLVSGHDAHGAPLEAPHIAFLPLAFVGHPHADGHLLGAALVLPRELSADVRRELLRLAGQVNELKLGRLGLWRLRRETNARPPWNLWPEAWTAADRGATHWSTVTPIAFDRHPKAKDPVAYQDECAAMIGDGCAAIGLPKPRAVTVSPVSAHMGVPPAHVFLRIVRKDGSERRHVHAILVFDEPVCGPIMLGAGRYRGYGFCRPIGEEKS